MMKGKKIKEMFDSEMDGQTTAHIRELGEIVRYDKRGSKWMQD